MRTIVQRFQSMRDFHETAAEYIVAAADRSITRDGAFYLALSGGRTPQGLYELLASDAWLSRIDWTRTWIFLTDDRALPESHPDSNWGMIRRLLLDRVPVPATQLFPMVSGQPLPQASAEYQQQISTHVPISPISGKPQLDVVLLGLGPDGHTASLFPGRPELDEPLRCVCEVPEPVGQPAWPRLTMTFPLLNSARSAIFLAAGQEKRLIVEAILEKLEDVRNLYPAARVKPVEERVWLLNTEMT